MEKCKSNFGGRTGYLVWLSLGVLLLLQVQYAHARENKTDPTDNVNLAPFRAWRSAYYCLQKKAPANCTSFENVSLTDKGILDVFPNEIRAYCSPASGCAQHVLDVLQCYTFAKETSGLPTRPLYHSSIKPFMMDAPIKLKVPISTLGWKSSGMKLHQKMYIPFIASLSTLAFIAIFNT
ncbi:hypothetical protein M0R45_017633 [Rubus argutus]|uniref:DUF7731 domain-containing protein n=1 Tax=Rubus argutus TaxID=59490 RepID=A0AAW1XWA3_RUBAR